MIDHGLGGVGHVFHEFFLAGPLIPREVYAGYAVDLLLADLAVGVSDDDVLHGAAHRVALEVGQNKHGVVVDDIFGHRNGLEVPTVLDGDPNDAFGVQDVDRTEVQPLTFSVSRCFSVVLRSPG